MPTRWRVEGFQSDKPTGFSREETAMEREIKLLLQRLAARHLTDDEITDATLGSASYFEINREKHRGEPTLLSTTGTDHHYLATEVKEV